MDCCFNRCLGRSTRVGHAVAAFIGAIPFHYYQEMQIYTHAVTCAIEMLWSRFLGSYCDESKPLKFLQDVPMAPFAYTVLLGCMFHVRLFYPWLGSRYLIRAADLLSNNS